MSKQKVKSVKWRRFSNAPYATFQSIHREVKIGVLSVAMLSSVSLKAESKDAGAKVVGAGIGSVEESAPAAPEDSLVVGLGTVEVLATRVPLTQLQAPRLVTVLSAVDIAAAAVHSINDLLEYAVGVDVRQRGEFGVQTDISVRGGTFDQITLLLNGVNISSPHTGHLTADFPVTVQDIERIEVLEGPCARVFGTSAFTGVINIVTKGGLGLTPDPSLAREGSKMLFGGSSHLYGGSYGYAGGDVRLSHTTPLSREGGVVGGSLSLGYSRSDGATPNSDFGSARGFYQGQYAKDELKLNLQFGYSYKQYGANTFYGASSTDQWESNEKYLGSLSFENKVGKRTHLSASVNWNRWFDHYQWHKDNPAGENFHKVDAVGGTVNAWFDSKLGRTSVGVEARYEGIYSTKLGKPMDEKDWVNTQGHDGTSDVKYKNRADRVNYSAFIEHDILLQDWTISLGVLANNNTALDSKWRLYPGVDVSYRPTDNWKLFASWNMALRMPTYTDLYYSGTNIVGTSDLKPEKTSDVSLGSRYRRAGIKAEASVFYSHKDDMIDWVIYKDEPDGKTFRSGNFTLDNYGVELLFDFLPQEIWTGTPLRKLGIQYAYINEDIEYVKPIISSKYAMEYLRHKVVANAETRLWKNLMLSLSWRWQDRVGSGNNPYSLLDGRLSWNSSRWSVYADCSNILDKTYYDYSYIPQPGRWGKIGVTISF